MLRLVFRVDSGVKIGSGHVMRCINIANHLSIYCESITFICVNHKGNISNLIEHPVKIIKKTENSWLGNKWIDDVAETVSIIQNLNSSNSFNSSVILIIDQYEIDYKWEDVVRPHVKKIMVIDDLADKKHNCDILLDQTIYADPIKNPYLELVPVECKLLLGGKYVILNDNFTEVKRRPRTKIKRICIFFGSSDSKNITGLTLQNIKDKFKNVSFDIIIGPINTKYNELINKYDKYDNFNFHYSLTQKEMANVVNQTDLCIGSSGTSTYERCAMGLFTLIITVANNQFLNAKNLQKLGVVDYIGNYDMDEASASHREGSKTQSVALSCSSFSYDYKNIIHLLVKKIEYYLESDDINWKEISERCYKMIDGKGLERTKNEILNN